MLALFSSGGVAAAPGTRVLRASEYLVLAEADELLARARDEADARRAAGEEAYEECRREGFAAGQAEGREQMAEQLIELMTASVDQVAAMEKSMVDIVMQSLRAILGSFDRGELVTEVVGHALRQVRDEKRVILRVSASDAGAVQARLADYAARYPGLGRIDVAADPGLAPGSCVLETAIGVVDAGLERQLALIEETFRRHLEARHG